MSDIDKSSFMEIVDLLTNALGGDNYPHEPYIGYSNPRIIILGYKGIEYHLKLIDAYTSHRDYNERVPPSKIQNSAGWSSVRKKWCKKCEMRTVHKGTPYGWKCLQHTLDPFNLVFKVSTFMKVKK